MKTLSKLPSFLFMCAVLFAAVLPINGQSTAFNYQGTLSDADAPANGSYDFEFRLFDQQTNGTQIGSAISANAIDVLDGSFSVELDFGDQFPGAARWLEIRVRQASVPASNEVLGGFTILAPRQPIATAPYAVRSSSSASADSAATADFATSAGSASTADSATTAGTATTADSATTAGTADNALNLGGVAAGQFVVTTDPRLSDARSPTAGSPDYIQNRTTQQANSNFNISGTGAASEIDVSNGYKVEGVRILPPLKPGSFFAGPEAGNDGTTGEQNVFVGPEAGFSNTSGSNNTIVGSGSGRNNSSGSFNSLFGNWAGRSNGAGIGNSMVGYYSGWQNTGDENSFFGLIAGVSNVTGSRNTILGSSADVGSSDLAYATAIGSGAVVSTSNTIQLGRADGSDAVNISGNLNVGGSIAGDLPSGDGSYIQNSTTTQASSNFNISGTGRAEVFDAGTQFNLNGVRFLDSNASGTEVFLGKDAGIASVNAGDATFVGNEAGKNNNGAGNSFFGNRSGFANTGGSNSFFGALSGEQGATGNQNSFFGAFSGNANTGGANSFFGSFSGSLNSSGIFNTFVGSQAGNTNTTGSNNTAIGYRAIFGAGNLNYATAIGSDAVVSRSNAILLGRNDGSDDVVLFGDLGIGTQNPNEDLHIVANSGALVLGDPNCPAGATAIGFLSSTTGSFDNCVNYSVRGNGTDLYLNRGAGGHIYIRETNGSSQIIIYSGGEVELRNLASAGSTALCRNGAQRIATCSSSLRYKNNVENFSSGSDILSRLRPVTFAWKDSGVLDLGLVAEEVAEIEPLLVTYNANGAVEGVKYDRIGVVLVNVVKEQQKTIESLRDEVKSEKVKGKNQNERIGELETRLSAQGEQIEALKAFVCADRPDAAVCQ